MNHPIQINQKLMEREDRLVEVFDLERQINAILGAPYPLAPPDGLPSRQKRKKKPTRKTATKATTIRVRKLDPECETAYRISYLENGVEKTEIHFDPKPLATLANTPLPNTVLQRIETVQKAANGAWETIATLA